MRTKVAPSESHLGHILGTKNKKTPIERTPLGFSEVPSGIYKWKGYERFGGYLFDIQLYVVKLHYLCFPYLSENVGKMRENVQKSFLSLWWENFRQFCYGM